MPSRMLVNPLHELPIDFVDVIDEPAREIHPEQRKKTTVFVIDDAQRTRAIVPRDESC
jgi:hypothetical protein